MQSFIVALLGARMNYAVPRILHGAGILNRLFTDFWSTKGAVSCLRAIPRHIRPNLVRRMLSRTARDLPSEKVVAFNRFGLQYAWRVRSAQTEDELVPRFLWAGREMCRRVNKSDWRNATGVFTFNSAGLETLELAKRRGLVTAMEQVGCPAETNHKLISREKQLHPEWEGPPERPGGLSEYAAREKREWALADRIICGSEFVRQNLAHEGVPVEKCAVVPYGVDLPEQAIAAREARAQRIAQSGHVESLNVLAIGHVELRKGICQFIDAARTLGRSARFRWVGRSLVHAEALETVRKSVHLVDVVPRAEVWQHYAWADVFLLPSISEGSATVTYEALSMGLPVICTPNTGSVVQDGVNGLLVPARNSDAIVEALETVRGDRDMLRSMSTAALHGADELTVRAYAQRLLRELRSLDVGDAPS